MKKTCLAVLSTVLVAACAPARVDGPSAEHGFNAFATGVGYLVASPFLIAAGLLEGISALPYFIATDLHAMNQSMLESQARVTLDQTYQHAYQKPLKDVPESGDTGKIFRHISEATEHFQRVLKGYGVEDYDRYILTAVRTADPEGFTLYAVVHRPVDTIRVLDKYGRRRVRMLHPTDQQYYQPFENDVNGAPLDVVIDWAGVPRTSIKTQKGQAILMTLAANSVLINRRSDDYWEAEPRWIAGEYRTIVAERKADLDARMGISS